MAEDRSSADGTQDDTAATVTSAFAEVSHTETVHEPRRGTAPLEDDGPFEPGTTIGRYVVIEYVASGAMGVIYKAYDPELDRRIALKFLRVDRKDSEANRARLLREAQALARLSHPNVIAVYDVGATDDDVFAAMEYVEGQTVKRWLREQHRPAHEVIDVFVAAGRGLAAVHEAGLIHRDFKPANVIIGDDGRVRVLDFGLASTTALEQSREEGSSDSELGSSDEPMLTRLTQTGAVVGTPAYMSPEQHRNEPVDPASDQFSFCVALYQALYGQRPYAGKAYKEFATNVVKGRIRPVPKRADVPAWIGAIVFRGLSPAAKDRYASMNALLEALRDDPRRKLRRRLGAAGVVGLAALAVFGLARGGAEAPEPCTGTAELLDGVWDDDVRVVMESSFDATKKPHAAQTFTLVGKLLDSYSARWTTMRTQACQATRVRGDQSEALLDLRVDCLERRRGSLAALTRLFVDDMNVDVLDNSIQAALNLPPIDACADAKALQATFPPPEAESDRKRVAEIRELLARARAYDDAGRFKDGLDLARTAVALADSIDYAPVRAEAYHRLGLSIEKSDKPKGAEAALFRAALDAARARDDITAAAVWTELVGVVGYDQAQHERALLVALSADAAVLRAGDAPLQRAALLNNIALVHAAKGDYEAARGYHERALAIKEKELGADDSRVAIDLNNLGIVLAKTKGLDAARPLYLRALEIREATFGDMHPYVADSHDNLGALLYHAGLHDEALPHYRRALAIRTKLLGAEHPDVGTSLNNLGGLLMDKGERVKAKANFERALAIWRKTLGNKHPDLAIPLGNLGDLALLAKKFERARTHCQQALDIEEAMRGSEHPSLAYSLTCLAEAYVGLRRAKEAVAVAERALRLRAEQDGAERARTEFALARALWSTPRARKRATNLARRARARFSQAGDHTRTRLAEVEAWLADGRGGPRSPQN